MTLAELIEQLRDLDADPDTVVSVWDPFHDRETDEVHVTVSGVSPAARVLIDNHGWE